MRYLAQKLSESSIFTSVTLSQQRAGGDTQLAKEKGKIIKTFLNSILLTSIEWYIDQYC